MGGRGKGGRPASQPLPQAEECPSAGADQLISLFSASHSPHSCLCRTVGGAPDWRWAGKHVRGISKLEQVLLVMAEPLAVGQARSTGAVGQKGWALVS